MGLLDKVIKGDSLLTSYNGNTPPTNILSTGQSKLLYPYSTTGADFSDVNDSYQSYLDGANNPLPNPSQLSFPNKTTKYLDNLPG
jgi:hypothetical protein